MSRLTARIIRLEDAAPNTWRAWSRVPVSQWPDHALEALVNEASGWPGGYVPTDDELRAAIGDDGVLDAAEDDVDEDGAT